MKKPDSAKRILLNVENIVAAQTILFAKIGENGPVISGYTGVGGKPNEFFTILEYFIDIVGRQSFGCVEVGDKGTLSRKV